jgi:hypothetical protein
MGTPPSNKVLENTIYIPEGCGPVNSLRSADFPVGIFRGLFIMEKFHLRGIIPAIDRWK